MGCLGRFTLIHRNQSINVTKLLQFYHYLQLLAENLVPSNWNFFTQGRGSTGGGTIEMLPPRKTPPSPRLHRARESIIHTFSFNYLFIKKNWTDIHRGGGFYIFVPYYLKLPPALFTDRIWSGLCTHR